MNMEWYRRKMADPETSTQEYMACWLVLREWEQAANVTYNAGIDRCSIKESNEIV